MKTNSFYLILVILLAVNSGRAADLTEVALFHRCYAHFTGQFLPHSDPGNALAPIGSPLRAQVKAGTKTALTACSELLNSSLLSAAGRLATENADSLSVLRNFNNFHRSWFGNDDLTSVLVEGQSATRFIMDESESALFVTRSLLTAGVNFSEIVTQSSSMEALRTSGTIASPPAVADSSGMGLTAATPEPYFSTYGLRYPIFISNTSGVSPSGNYLAFPIMSGQIVQLGELLGIRLMSANTVKLAMSGFEGNPGGFANREFSNSKPVKPNESLGGGVLGTKSYLALNLGRTDNKTQDGGLIVHRRWAKAVYKNLLCRELPVVRTTDSLSFVQQTTGPSFRLSNTCMHCHASMDPLAYSIRHTSYSFLPFMSADVGNQQIGVWDTTITTDPTAAGPVNANTNFHRTPPNGVIYFRDYKGNLVNLTTSGGPAGVGQRFAQLDDLYVCAASRYFEYFTGIHVPLRDPAGVTLSPAEQAYADQVAAWGIELKTTQNLRTLIERIISSPIYRRTSLK